MYFVPILFNIFLKQIMSNAMEEHDGNVTRSCRSTTNLRFVDTDALAEEQQELKALVERLNKTCTRIRTEQAKLMTNSANSIQRVIKVNEKTKLMTNNANNIHQVITVNEKTKLMTYSANSIQRVIKVNEKQTGTATSLKYLREIVSDDGSKPEIL